MTNRIPEFIDLHLDAKPHRRGRAERVADAYVDGQLDIWDAVESILQSTRNLLADPEDVETHIAQPLMRAKARIHGLNGDDSADQITDEWRLPKAA